MRYGQRSGPPSWFVILLGISIVFGVYYLWVGLRNFMASGASVVESTRQAIVQNTATAVRIHELEVNAPTPLPSFTPVPPCQEFAVIVREAIVRSEPSTNSRIVDALKEGETVCVITKTAGLRLVSNRPKRRLPAASTVSTCIRLSSARCIRRRRPP